MPFISYTRKRRLLAGSNGKLEGFDLADYDVDIKEKSVVHIPLDQSNGETVFHGERDYIKVTAGFIHKNEIEKWREFKSSTAAGETFVFDAYGTEAAPDNAITVKREKNGYKESRINPFYYNIDLTFSYKAY